MRRDALAASSGLTKTVQIVVRFAIDLQMFVDEVDDPQLYRGIAQKRRERFSKVQRKQLDANDNPTVKCLAVAAPLTGALPLVRLGDLVADRDASICEARQRVQARGPISRSASLPRF